MIYSYNQLSELHRIQYALESIKKVEFGFGVQLFIEFEIINETRNYLFVEWNN